jgi:Icc-related predicted phosphoesterase
VKFQLISDVHCEFHRDGGKSFCATIPVAADTLVIAGDFGTRPLIFARVSELVQKFDRVLYVCGNHEFYGHHTRDQINRVFHKLENRFSNFSRLQNSTVTVDSVKFVGTTLWFDQTPDTVLHRRLLNDYSQIRSFDRWVGKENEKAKVFLEDTVSEGCVVITHHAPSYASVSERFKGRATNAFFVSNVERIVRENNPAVWCHGHMHEPVRYECYDTTVVSNPLGYPGENTSNSETCVVDIGTSGISITRW